ncbi:MAG: OmpA family protein [Desulfobulbaceae bacterium]|nr:OmpA family protein [Desulfobulbaceae bacterium]
MRNYIFGISLFLFTLSAVFTFKSLMVINQKKSDANELSNSRLPVSRSTSSRTRLTPRESSLREDSTSLTGRVYPDPPEAIVDGITPPGDSVPIDSPKAVSSSAHIDKGLGQIARPPLDHGTKPVVLQSVPAVDANAFVLGVLGGFSPTSEGVAGDRELNKTVLELVPLVLSSPGNKLIIEGHTEKFPSINQEKESFETSRIISQNWAQKVGDLFVKNGVPSNQITAIGYGYSKPVNANDTAEARSKNRRVVIKLVIAE